MVEFKVIKGSSTGALVDAVSSREIKSDEVLIDVTHSGVCFTDHVCRCPPLLFHTKLYTLTVTALSASGHGPGS